MPIDMLSFRVLFLFGLVLSLPFPGCAQLYHSFSLRTSEIGFATDAFAGFNLTPRYSIGNRHLQAEVACEVPVRALTNGDKWAGLELYPGESIDVHRYLGKARLKSQPQVGSLGIVYAAANLYALDIQYTNAPLFEDTALDTTLIMATFGAGLFGFWELHAPPINLIGAELLLLTDFDTIESTLEIKTLVFRAWKLGVVLETLQPKPRFTEMYFSAYIEYEIRW